MMKVEPFFLRLQILLRVGSPDWDKSERDIFGSVYVDEKRRRSRTLFGSNSGLLASTLKLQVLNSDGLTSVSSCDGSVVSFRPLLAAIFESRVTGRYRLFRVLCC